VVVIPSISYPLDVLEQLGGTQHYEERFLILMMLLRDPLARLIYVTSEPIAPSIVDYYLHLLPGVIPSQARRRLFLVSTLDGGLRSLSEKLLERPQVIQRLRELIEDPKRAYMVPFNTTEAERELAVELEIPIYGADPKFLPLGTKSGCRKLFDEIGIPHPSGFEDLVNLNEVGTAIGKLRATYPELQGAFVKTNEGVSGYGIILVKLEGLPPPGEPTESAAIEGRLRQQLPGEAYADYGKLLAASGGIVEEKIAGDEIRSPSVQILITPLGQVQVLSTHDQLLGGSGGANYIGCRFPADQSYAQVITEQTLRIGKRLAEQGVVGRAAVDFVMIPSGDGWAPYAIELNLRQGGTTHPFLTLQFLTDGRYIPEEATFIAPNGRRKFFVASDHVESPNYRGFTPDDLFDLVVRHRLHYDHAQQTGVVFHMMSALPELGRTGMTAVADSPEEAGWMYDRVIQALDEESKLAFKDRGANKEPSEGV